MPNLKATASETDRTLAANAVSHARLISDAGQLAALVERWLGAPALALDTEFVRERTFYPQPGLVQISDGQAIYLLDAVALPSMPSLARLLGQADQDNILHSVGEDLEVLRILCAVVPRPLFDTQIAAALLGYPLQCRYESLVAEVLEVELPGGKARSDWRKRPLTRDLTTYAAQDVIWLPRLREVLAEALDRQGRLAWLRQDCDRLVDAACQPASEPALLRVKGAGNLADDALERLARLAEWREREARRRDLPRGFVLRDDTLLLLAAAATSAEREKQLRLLPPGAQRRYTDALMNLLEQDADSRFSRPPALIQLTQEQREQIKLCQKQIGSVAASLQIDPALLASRREITRVIRGEKPGWLDGWRREFLAEFLPLDEAS